MRNIGMRQYLPIPIISTCARQILHLYVLAIVFEKLKRKQAPKYTNGHLSLLIDDQKY